jgi:hypothetical protein
LTPPMSRLGSSALFVRATVMPTGMPVFIAGGDGTSALMQLPPLQYLTEGRTYRVECAFTGGNGQRRTFHFNVRRV